MSSSSGSLRQRLRVRQVGTEFVCDADQFVEVIEPGEVLRVARRLQLGAVAGAVEHRLDEFAEFTVEAPAQFVEHLDEARDGLLGAGVQHRHLALGSRLQRVVEARAGVLRIHRHARLGPIADAATWRVQDAPHADRVARIVQHPQIGDDVADLPAFVKANAANDFVRNTGADEDLFQRTRRVVGAVEHRDVVVSDVAPVGERVDLPCHEPRLVVLVVGDVADDQLALAGIGPQPLLAAAGVAGDHRVGGVQDVLCRAVVLFQQNRSGIGVVALEVLDVADGRAAERVDGLVGVAHHAQFCGCHAVLGLSVRRPVRAPTRTARGWCPGTRRRGCAGTAAGSTGRSAERLAAQRLSRR